MPILKIIASPFVRIWECILIQASIIDIEGQLLIRTVLYVFTGRNKPARRETISAWCAAEANAGSKIGVFFVNIIDFIFGKGHCAAAIVIESAYAKPVN